MLPDHDLVAVQVGTIGPPDLLVVLLQHDPPDVAVPEPLADGVRVFLGVCVPVVRAVAARPPPD